MENEKLTDFKSPISIRFGLLDLFRLVAALGVVCLHVRFEASQGLDPQVWVRTFSRWCVPFFFLVTGFFLKANTGGFPLITANLLKKVGIILVASWCIYVPLGLIQSGFALLSADLFVTGPWFHLWYLHSLFLGLAALLVLPSVLKSRAILGACAAVCFVVAHGIDMAAQVDPERFREPFNIARQFQSFPLLYLGFLMGRSNMSRAASLRFASLLTVIGIGLCIFEALVWVDLGWGFMDRQYPIGMTPIALGLVWFGTRSNIRIPELFARLGRENALPIYLLHPFFIVVLQYFGPELGLSEPWGVWCIIVMSAFGSLGLSLLIDRVLPAVSRFLSGRLSDSSFSRNSV